MSIFCHGLGDPASDYRRWPCLAGRWQQTRGVLAGRWAHHGIATLAPWLPGAGPSQPLGTYSPLSLDGNAQAIADGFLALRHVEALLRDHNEVAYEWAGGVRLDHQRQVLRTDCVSTSMLIYFASQWRRNRWAGCEGLRVFVADDFQPSVAYNVYFLEPYLRRQTPLAAASIFLIWARLIWALAVAQGWPVTDLFNARAASLFSERCETPIGPLPRILASRLVPALASELAPLVANGAAREFGRAPTGEEIRDFVYSRPMAEWMSLGPLEAIVGSSFYRRYFSASDPFFADNIKRFDPAIPLLVVRRAGDRHVQQLGMPSFDDRFHQMTMPKIRTLRSWGWDVQLYDRGPGQGTSFGNGPAQRWALAEVNKVLDYSAIT